MKLTGKIVLITGAARRIGREIALTLARRGAQIIIHYNRSYKEAVSLEREIRQLGTNAWMMAEDFSAKKGRIVPAIERFVKRIYQRVPRIDVLVNNAAIYYPTPFGKIREKDWDELMDVNLKTPFFLAQAIGSKMFKQKSGKIVNLADWTGLRPSPDYLPYCISKAGLIAATYGLAKSLAPYVQAAGIAPGPILPAQGMGKRQTKQAVARRTLLQRFGSSSDIAQTVRYFIEDTDFVTGALLPVEGGALWI